MKERVKTENYNEVTSDSQQKYLGDAIPKLFGGFTNNFSYKGIDLSFMIYYSIGGKLYDSDYAQSMYYRRGYSMHPDMLDSWTPENPNAEFPRLTTYYNYANYIEFLYFQFIFNKLFARLRNVRWDTRCLKISRRSSRSIHYACSSKGITWLRLVVQPVVVRTRNKAYPERPPTGSR